MFDNKDTAQMLKDIMEKQASTITKLDILHRQLVDSDENLTFRYSAILNTLVEILNKLDAAQRKQDGKRCPDQTPPPPKEPRLCETFVQFMAEPVVNRAYTYYHLTGGYNLTNKNMDAYLKHNTNLYDCPAFAELLRETPVRCIL